MRVEGVHLMDIILCVLFVTHWYVVYVCLSEKKIKRQYVNSNCSDVLPYVGGCGVNQAYSRLSTTRGHITDCKLDSVVYAW